MQISAITNFLESLAHPSLQESYDNSGLITGNASWECTGIICSLDATDEVIKEAISSKCNLVVAHHPVIFSGLKKINGKNYVEKTIITAIKNDIAIYAIHTSIDNVINGVSGRMAEKLGLQHVEPLVPKPSSLKKLYTFVPAEKLEDVRNALFKAGGGYIGQYSECSFVSEGTGSFKAGEGAHPYVGDKGERHYEKEQKIEVVFPSYMERELVSALIAAHPYEEVAYDVVALSNTHPGMGSGVVGTLPAPVNEIDFLEKLRQVFGLKMLRHTRLLEKPVHKIALCGGSGSSFISNALAKGVDAYVTADIKYHDFFDANDRLLIADIGHYESEQYTIELLAEHLEQKFPTFAVLKTRIETNPVRYFTGS